jgi:hypothetical protein
MFITLYVLCSILIIITGSSIIALRIALKKIDFYEDAINEYYSQTAIVLHSMRALDERQMFESDDEVGSVFNQLTEIVNTLRPVIYSISEDADDRQDKENRFTDEKI